MENLDQINKLTGGLRHIRIRDADQHAKYSVPVDTVPRPGFNTTGKEIEVKVNTFPIVKFPSKTVYQYDVSTILPSSIIGFPVYGSDNSDVNCNKSILVGYYANKQRRSTLATVPRNLR